MPELNMGNGFSNIFITNNIAGFQKVETQQLFKSYLNKWNIKYDFTSSFLFLFQKKITRSKSVMMERANAFLEM